MQNHPFLLAAVLTNAILTFVDTSNSTPSAGASIASSYPPSSSTTMASSGGNNNIEGVWLGWTAAC